jgi:serine/threonine protein kinase
MHTRLVVHLDIKADNVLIRPGSDVAGSDVSLLLGDFGEAMVLGQGAAVIVKHSRGTECIQAPEMLMAGKLPPCSFMSTADTCACRLSACCGQT